MSDDPRLEEMAACHALGLLDPSEIISLRQEAESNPELQRQLAVFAEAATSLAYDVPQIAPPPTLKTDILRHLPAQRRTAKIISFPQWIPYALAACLMALAVFEANEVFTLNRQIGAEHAKVVALQQRNNLTELRLASLEAKTADYMSAKVMVAWDPQSHNGVVSIQNLPAPPAGHDYQLWVLDPKAQAPISAGLLKNDATSQGFAVQPVRSDGPGFAISLEPSGGRPAPTGAILFAVAPGQ